MGWACGTAAARGGFRDTLAIGFGARLYRLERVFGLPRRLCALASGAVAPRPSHPFSIRRITLRSRVGRSLAPGRTRFGRTMRGALASAAEPVAYAGRRSDRLALSRASSLGRPRMTYRHLRLLALAAALPLLGHAVSTTAAVACPAVGTVLYQDNTCATPSSTRAPCYKYVVTSVSGGIAYANKYANAYYTWAYVGRAGSVRLRLGPVNAIGVPFPPERHASGADARDMVLTARASSARPMAETRCSGSPTRSAAGLPTLRPLSWSTPRPEF